MPKNRSAWDLRPRACIKRACLRAVLILGRSRCPPVRPLTAWTRYHPVLWCWCSCNCLVSNTVASSSVKSLWFRLNSLAMWIMSTVASDSSSASNLLNSTNKYIYCFNSTFPQMFYCYTTSKFQRLIVNKGVTKHKHKTKPRSHETPKTNLSNEHTREKLAINFEETILSLFIIVYSRILNWFFLNLFPVGCSGYTL